MQKISEPNQVVELTGYLSKSLLKNKKEEQKPKVLVR